MSKVSVALCIAPDHPAFPGHFPGRPIVPGVVLLDAALKAIARGTGLDLAACHLEAVKFLYPVGPAQPLALEFEHAAGGSIRFAILNAERRVATGSVRPRAPVG